VRNISIYSFHYVNLIPFLASIFNLFCGIALLKVNYRRDWNRTTGLIFLLNAIVLMSMGMKAMAADGVHHQYWEILCRNLDIPIALLMVHFVMIFPQPWFNRKITRAIHFFLVMFVVTLFILKLLNGVIFSFDNFQFQVFLSKTARILYLLAFNVIGFRWIYQYSL